MTKALSLAVALLTVALAAVAYLAVHDHQALADHKSQSIAAPDLVAGLQQQIAALQQRVASTESGGGLSADARAAVGEIASMRAEIDQLLRTLAAVCTVVQTMFSTQYPGLSCQVSPAG